MTDEGDGQDQPSASGARGDKGSGAAGRSGASGETASNAAGRALHLFLLIWMPAAALMLILSGVLLLAQGPGPSEIGWFAYTPLPEAGLPDGVMLFSRGMRAGALLVLAGAMLFAFWGGLQAGSRRRPRGKPS